MVFLFTLTSALAAALLFLVQPMVARMVLPAFGGAPQVWTTAMLFFQTALLAGYAYTHWATNRLTPVRQLGLHFLIVAIPILFLPIRLMVQPSGGGGLTPALELLFALMCSVAVPFMVVATSGPLIQRWFSWTNHRNAQDPYFLYAAGNVGSIGGLLIYPFLVEPNLSVIQQTNYWSAGYWLAAGLLTICNFTVLRRLKKNSVSNQPLDRERQSLPVEVESVGLSRIAKWLLLAFVPSSLMLGVTAHLSTDVAAIPLLWVLPLSVYLLTFTIAFSRFGPSTLNGAVRLAPVVVVAAVCLNAKTLGTTWMVALQIGLVFVGGMLGHGKLAEDRPLPAQLTKFYLTLSVGGALGGLFNGLLAPLLFPAIFEYGLVAALALALTLGRPRTSNLPNHAPNSGRPLSGFDLALSLGLFALPLIILALVHWDQLPDSHFFKFGVLAVLFTPLGWLGGQRVSVVIATLIVGLYPPWVQVQKSEMIQRTFFGVHRVLRNDQILQLVHGTTIHGRQDVSSFQARQVPLSYYHVNQPLGQVMQKLPPHGSLGVIGLGAGSIAAYAQADQEFVFYEIDPAVVHIAESNFFYLQDARDRGALISTDQIGDGRLMLQQQPRKFQILVVDAFSSDAIPVHLLTVEAIQVYLDSIESDGLIAIHISNNYLDLAPVLAGAAETLGIAMLQRFGRGDQPHVSPSHWVILARQNQSLQPLRELGWQTMPDKKIVWTDQLSSIWAVRKR